MLLAMKLPNNITYESKLKFTCDLSTVTGMSFAIEPKLRTPIC